MAIFQETLTVKTRGRGTLEISHDVDRVVRSSGIVTGLCNVFLAHTSASIILTENADPSVRRDLEYFMAGLIRDGDPGFEHTAEGADDMSAHVRSVLTQNSINVPVAARRCALGTWQGLFLWEHRAMTTQRQLYVTVHGE